MKEQLEDVIIKSIEKGDQDPDLVLWMIHPSQRIRDAAITRYGKIT